MKKLVLAITLSGVISTHAMASVMDPASPVSSPITQVAMESTHNDLGQIFQSEQTKPMQIAAMSKQEMSETEGAYFYVPIAIAYGIAWGGANAATLARMGIGVWRGMCHFGVGAPRPC